MFTEAVIVFYGIQRHIFIEVTVCLWATDITTPVHRRVAETIQIMGLIPDEMGGRKNRLCERVAAERALRCVCTVLILQDQCHGLSQL